MEGVNFRAVFVGTVVDVTGSIIVGGAILAVAAMSIGATTPEQLTAALQSSVGLQLLAVTVGLLFVVFGAYVAARIARQAEMANAFVVGLLSTALSFLVVFAEPESSPFWSQAASLVLTIPAAFLGGQIRILTMGKGTVRR